MSTITKHHLDEIRGKLPHRYIEGLKERLNSNNISMPLISSVMHGHKEDYYGIIKAAIEWASEIEAEKEKLLKEANKLINK